MGFADLVSFVAKWFFIVLCSTIFGLVLRAVVEGIIIYFQEKKP